MSNLLKIIEELGVELVDLKTNNYKTQKEKIIHSINCEINLIKEREDLNLKRIKKLIKGNEVEFNESRFWKFQNGDIDFIYVNIKYKGKIQKFGLEGNMNKGFKIKNDKNTLIQFLENFKNKIELIDSKNIGFWGEN